MQLFERLCTTFFTHNAPLVSDGDYYSSEDVFTALPYAKGRRYFDAVALKHILRFCEYGGIQSPLRMQCMHMNMLPMVQDTTVGIHYHSTLV